jgi:hypothetical protein
MKKILFLISLAVLFSFAFVSAIDISTCEELQNMSNDLAGNYVVINDIDCDGVTFYPIGDNTLQFSGNFDGQGYTISNVTISASSPVGFFGYITTVAVIKNVRLENIDITGGAYTGGLVGRSDGGEIYNCSTSGIVSGGPQVGGLVGYHRAGSITNNSYSNVNVTGTGSNAGGLVGNNEGSSIINSYSTGKVTGSSGVGGLVATSPSGGTCINSFWDNQTSERTTSACSATGKTTSQMKQISTYTNWNIATTENDLNNGYPYLGYNTTIWLIYEELINYNITTCEDLQNMNLNFSGDYILMNDINCSDTISWNGGEGFIPVDNFTGTFDGQGYIINDLYINKNTTFLGLFGHTLNAIISNVGLENINITGNQYVGGLVAILTNSNISKCYTTGEIVCNASSSICGGLIGRGGFTSSKSIINNSYSTVNLNGKSGFSGFAGYGLQYVFIYNSYSTGEIINTSSTKVGGFTADGTITNSFWDIETSGLTYSSAGSQGKTTEEMKDITTFSNAGWDIALIGDYVDEIWFIDDGNDYPKLNFDYEQVYNITTCQELQRINNNLSGDYLLVNDIDCSDTVSWNAGAGFISIDGVGGFTGTFDGQGYTISDLYIDNNLKDDVGLFGFVTGSISNVNLIDIDITGNNEVGGLVGFLEWGGSVDNCNISGEIYGNDYVGGLVGFHSGNINNSHTTGSVTGNDGVGGLVGISDAGNIYNSYSLEDYNVNGANYVGGLIGYNYGVINNCYTTGTTIGSGDAIGGLVGYNDYGSLIINSYAIGEVYGNSYLGGLVGFNANAGYIESSYAIGDVTGVSAVGGLVGYNEYVGFINNCYATGDVYGDDDNSFTGGLVGVNDGNISNSYAIGEVTGNYYLGGLVEDCAGAYIVENSFWDINTTGQSTSCNSNFTGGKTTSEMKSLSTFTNAGWDIALTEDDLNDGYAYLGWQDNNETTWLMFEAEPELVCGILDPSNYTTVGGTIIAVDGSPFLNSYVNVSFDYTYKKNSQAGQSILDTTEALTGVTGWFGIIIVIVAMVVLIFLVVLIVRAVKNTGFTA